MTLDAFFAANRKAALAFSGGTDSALLLFYGVNAGCDIQPYFVKSCFQPQFELDDAQRLCRELGVYLRVIELDVLADPNIACNSNTRCYYCKHRIFSSLIAAAKADGYTLILDGTNASDCAEDRPGMRALNELLVRSPLRECGITKDMVREMSKKYGLFTWNKPAYACLATRIPSGTTITAGTLQAVEHSENMLFNLGFTDFRVRVSGDMAKLQFPEEQFFSVLEHRNEILTALGTYFNEIVLDLKSR
jgi:uncharacterized protein